MEKPLKNIQPHLSPFLLSVPLKMLHVFSQSFVALLPFRLFFQASERFLAHSFCIEIILLCKILDSGFPFFQCMIPKYVVLGTTGNLLEI